MPISIFMIKKWYRMLTGRSVSHITQDVGKCYSTKQILGYYNDFTGKVKYTKTFTKEGIPLVLVDTGEEVVFSIAVFQFGLGAYDLYLLTNKQEYLVKAELCAQWAVNNQMPNGAWDTFYFDKTLSHYSAMAQGEGISLLLRIYQETNDNSYLLAASKAVEFMLLPVDKGGVTEYIGDKVIFLEYINKPAVLNGWIFSLWGLYDYIKICPKIYLMNLYDKAIKTLVVELPNYDLGFWSKYDLGKTIASPFYHRLHIAQMEAMFKITKNKQFLNIKKNFTFYLNNKFYFCIAFIRKAIQKILE